MMKQQKFLILIFLFSTFTILSGQYYVTVNQSGDNNKFTSTGSYNTLRFYLFDDGWYSKQHHPLQKYPTNLAYLAKTYFIAPYDDSDPPQYTTPTIPINHYDQAPLPPSFINFTGDVAFDKSWHPVNDNENYFIFLFQKNNNPANGTVQFHYNANQITNVEIIDHAVVNGSNPRPNLATLQQPVISTSNQQGYTNKITWSYSNLQGNRSKRAVYLKATTLLDPGENINFGAGVNNNPLTHTTVPVKAYPHDPNYIKSSSCILGSLPSQKVTYTVHFQNTGDGTAKDVVIHEQLNRDVNFLDLSTAQLITSSHPCVLEPIDPNGPLIFTLQNIKLKGTGELLLEEEEQSKAWVTYEICAYPILASNCFSHNADVYFDDLPPVSTSPFTICAKQSGCIPEYCENTPSIRSISNLENLSPVSIYPNPATDILNVMIRGKSDKAANIYNAMGGLIEKVEFSEDDNEVQINLHSLPPGMYYVQIQVGVENYVYKFVKL